MRSLAYGETVAPEQVDTLRDEECPICGADSDAFDGDQCQECGFVLPPAFVRDPDLELAKQLDLRGKDSEPPTLTPEEAGPGGPTPGPVPLDPGQLAEDGSVPGEDGSETIAPDDVPEDDEAELDEGADLPPEQQPDVDPAAAEQHMQQGGESFTEGPNDPDRPGEPEMPVDPQDLDEEGELTGEPEPGQEEVPEDAPVEGAPEDGAEEPQEDPEAPDEVPGAGDGEEDTSGEVEGDVETLADGELPDQQATTVGEPPPPGTPGDETPDLVCPACGYTAPAARPTSTSMDDPTSPDAEDDGLLAGDACPQCGMATVMPISELEEMDAEEPVEEGVEPEDDAGGAPEEEAEAPEEDEEAPEEDDQDEEGDQKKPPPFA